MYCPIDGDEFREGITRCPEHNVDLVEELPDLEEPASWIDRFNDRTAVRLSFLVLLLAAVIYAIAGFITAGIYLMTQLQHWKTIETAQVFNQVQAAAFPVGIAAFGALAGALLLRTYLLFSDGASVSSSSDEESSVPGPIPGAIMRLLFALTVVFALLWAGTGIATSRDQVENSASFRFGGAPEEPDDSFITLLTLNHVGYTGASPRLRSWVQVSSSEPINEDIGAPKPPSTSLAVAYRLRISRCRTPRCMATPTTALAAPSREACAKHHPAHTASIKIQAAHARPMIGIAHHRPTISPATTAVGITTPVTPRV